MSIANYPIVHLDTLKDKLKKKKEKRNQIITENFENVNIFFLNKN